MFVVGSAHEPKEDKMTYVLTDGGSSVLQYPYSSSLLRSDNPTVSFPANLTEELLAEWSVFPVFDTPPPTYDVLASSLSESMSSPDFVDGQWVRVWEVSPLDAASAESVYNQLAASSKSQLVELLRQSDAYVTQSFEESRKLHPDFVAYRSALKSPETLPGYPAATVYPSMPENIFQDAVDLSGDFEDTIS